MNQLIKKKKAKKRNKNVFLKSTFSRHCKTAYFKVVLLYGELTSELVCRFCLREDTSEIQASNLPIK